jgi:hypothetical protein
MAMRLPLVLMMRHAVCLTFVLIVSSTFSRTTTFSAASHPSHSPSPVASFSVAMTTGRAMFGILSAESELVCLLATRTVCLALVLALTAWHFAQALGTALFV